MHWKITMVKDFFEDLYSSTSLNVLDTFAYVFGLFGGGTVLFVSWYERTGQAGPYRTLVNQLASFNLDQVRTSNP